MTDNAPTNLETRISKSSADKLVLRKAKFYGCSGIGIAVLSGMATGFGIDDYHHGELIHIGITGMIAAALAINYAYSIIHDYTAYPTEYVRDTYGRKLVFPAPIPTSSHQTTVVSRRGNISPDDAA